jgi:RNA polymerase-binding transcription factor
MNTPPGIDIDAFLTLLNDRKKDLESSSKATRNLRKPVELDQQSVGRLSRQDALQQQAMAKAQETRRGIELLKIDSALARIEEDEFGWCADCGEAITVKRLFIDPTARLCVTCVDAK